MFNVQAGTWEKYTGHKATTVRGTNALSELTVSHQEHTYPDSKHHWKGESECEVATGLFVVAGNPPFPVYSQHSVAKLS